MRGYLAVAITAACICSLFVSTTRLCAQQAAAGIEKRRESVDRSTSAKPAAARELSESEKKRREMGDRMDRHGLRERRTAVTEQSKEMLRVPEHISAKAGFKVARAEPKVEMLLVPVKPRYFLEPKAENLPIGLWSAWSQGTYFPPAGRFYAALGNHIYYDAQIHILEYDPESRSIRLTSNINEALGRGPDDFGDGKIHGWMDFYNGAETYFCTYWCHYPEPSEEEYRSGYEGGRLMSYNVLTGRFTDFGTPLRRTSWCYHRMDRRRGLLFAVGVFREFLCYDVVNRRTLWAGHLPHGLTWYDRNMLVDEETGCAYSSNVDPSDPEAHIIRYNALTGRFYRMKCSVPKNELTGEVGQIRAHTGRRAREGWFMCAALGGQMFKFYPDEERVEDVGICWRGDPKRLYTTSIAISPDDKYCYYVPGAHGQSHYEGTPIIQLDTRSGERKVLAFLYPYFYDKYGYIASGTFSIDIDDRGERLFILFNGAFSEFRDDGGDVFGDPAVFVIHIPESERA